MNTFKYFRVSFYLNGKIRHTDWCRTDGVEIDDIFNFNNKTFKDWYLEYKEF